MLPRLDVVIVNWNSGGLLRQCLSSLAGSCESGHSLGRVVVVDNASTDDSLERLHGLPLDLTVVRNAENVGIVGVQLRTAQGEVARTCARFPSLPRFLISSLGLDRAFPGRVPGYMESEWDHANSREVVHVMGAFYLVRRAAFLSLDGFDERFFLYLEDLDFSVRAGRRGWRVFFLSSAHIIHLGCGSSAKVKGRRLFYSARSRIQFAAKYYAAIPRTIAALCVLTVEPLARLLHAVLSGSPSRAWETLQGWGSLWHWTLAQILLGKGRRRRRSSNGGARVPQCVS